MALDLLVNTAHTLSVNASPGEDKRFPNTSLESIFAFGDFRIHRDLTPHSLSADTGGLSFSNYSTLSSLSGASDIFDAHKVINIHENELNLVKDDPNSYTFYGSFYTKVVASINNIIRTWPYAMLSYAAGTGSTILNYVNNWNNTASFSIPVSALTNQGGIIYASGYTYSTSAVTEINLFSNFNQFEIELSGASMHQSTFPILTYGHDTVNAELDFTIQGYLFSASTATTTVPVYIRPSVARYFQYKQTITDLEYQLLFESKFLVPSPDDDTFSRQSFIWPKSIDGFNPDSYGIAYDSYFDTITKACTAVDEVKTNWMVRTMIPENYLELDSQGYVYRKLVSVYAEEFDKIKKYIDNLAYAHTVTYDNEASIPDKFLSKLSRLLGWEPINEFNESDIFEYLAGEDLSGNTVSNYNNNLWKRILININWLYKKKGTRDALQFIFKLMGAPDCLINFNEFVYTISRSVTGTTATQLSEKIRESTGYINYDASTFAFQEGGEGRGNGDAYINQWRPYFNPQRIVDNRKVLTGTSEQSGTENLVNTKEVEVELSPAAAIECDTNSWFDNGFTDNRQLSTGHFSYINLNSVQLAVPASISAMTMAQWMEYVYANSIDPRSHKVEGWDRHTYFYKNLKDVYLTYYYWSLNNQTSNQLTFRRLEKFMTLIQRNFGAYIYRLLPATTIVDRDGITYRNTMFNRQKFVYPPGINSGSEFQIPVPPSPDLIIKKHVVNSTVNDIIRDDIRAVNVVSTIAEAFNQSINVVTVTNSVSQGISQTINAVTVEADLQTTTVNYRNPTPQVNAVIIMFPPDGIPQAQPNPVPTPYRTRTTSLTATAGGAQSGA